MSRFTKQLLKPLLPVLLITLLSPGIITGNFDCRDMVEYTISVNGVTKGFVDMACSINRLDKIRKLFSVKP